MEWMTPWLLAAICFLFSQAVCVLSDDPPGHLKPLGGHAPPVGDIAVLTDFPQPSEFYNSYVKDGKPVLFRGVLERMKFPAYTKWTDEYLGNTFGDVTVEVEKGKKEDRNLGLNTMPLKTFLETYKTLDVYLVHDLPFRMREDIYLPKCLGCGGFQYMLTKVVTWFSSGGTKSVLHSDEFDNINCLLDGTKDLVFIDTVHEDLINKDGWVDVGWMSKIDVDSVDMYKYPAFKDIPWYKGRLEKGDCVFIPNRWYHQVNSYGDRNLAVNIWFYPLPWFNDTDCSRRSVALQEEPINKHSLVGIEELWRTMLLQTIPDEDKISKEDFDYAWELVIPDYQIKMEVFKNFDTDKDDFLSWKELHAFNVTNFVKSYQKFLGNEIMAEYKRIQMELSSEWYEYAKEQTAEMKDEL